MSSTFFFIILISIFWGFQHIGSNANTIEQFKGKAVAIIGDIVADQFLSGTITRVSREAPVFIMRHDETETRPGGAANAAVNVASLGGDPLLVGIVGADTSGDLLIGELEKRDVRVENILRADEFHTTTKIRVLAGHQHAPRSQVIRIDHEPSGVITPEIKKAILGNAEAVLATADAVVISDYGYGASGRDVFEHCLAIADQRGIPILVDSRFRLSEFRGATAGTPNQEEVENLLGGKMTDTGCERLRQDLGYRALLVTCGNKGMRLYQQDVTSIYFPAVGSSTAVDVTGAGDTVIATFALGLAAGLNFEEAARIANHSGGIVVMKKGTASVSVEELRYSLETETSGTSKSDVSQAASNEYGTH